MVHWLEPLGASWNIIKLCYMVSHISNLISTKGKCVLTELEEIPVIERTEQVKEGSLPSLWLCCCVPSLVTHDPIDLKFKCDNCPSADVMTWLTYKFSEYHCQLLPFVLFGEFLVNIYSTSCLLIYFLIATVDMISCL